MSGPTPTLLFILGLTILPAQQTRRPEQSQTSTCSMSFDGIRHRAAGEELTLDDIEHGRLRTDYNEPRIHFALVCAALSCPPLREEAYRGDILDEQLDDQGRAFLNDPRENRLERERGRVHLSKIFDSL